jgi:hypothetical protein
MTSGGWSGRVMIITGKGETVYTGHPAVNNTGHPFTPGDLEFNGIYFGTTCYARGH